MDALSKEQLRLIREVTPAQRAEIATQRSVLKHQIKNPTSSAKKPQGGRTKSKRTKSKTSRKTRRRGGYTKGAIPYGKRCVFPDESATSETRTFTPGELVCYRELEGDPTPKSAVYLMNLNPYVHRIQQTVDDAAVYAPWMYVGKLVDSSTTPGFSNEPSGTGAAGNGSAASGTSDNAPLLVRSNAYGVGGRKRTTTRRR